MLRIGLVIDVLFLEVEQNYNVGCDEAVDAFSTCQAPCRDLEVVSGARHLEDRNTAAQCVSSRVQRKDLGFVITRNPAQVSRGGAALAASSSCRFRMSQ